MENRTENGHNFDSHDDGRDPLDPYRTQAWDFSYTDSDYDFDDGCIIHEQHDAEAPEILDFEEEVDELALAREDREIEARQAKLDEAMCVSHSSINGASGYRYTLLEVRECFEKKTQRGCWRRKISWERRKPRHIRRGKRDRVKWENFLFDYWYGADVADMWSTDRMREVSERMGLPRNYIGDLPDVHDDADDEWWEWWNEQHTPYPTDLWDFAGGWCVTAFELLEIQYNHGRPMCPHERLKRDELTLYAN